MFGKKKRRGAQAPTFMKHSGKILRTIVKQLKDIGYTPDIYSPEFTLVTPELIKNCHDLNMKIIPWTVNDKKKIEELKKMGVDGIITDYPNLFNE